MAVCAGAGAQYRMQRPQVASQLPGGIQPKLHMAMPWKLNCSVGREGRFSRHQLMHL